jgi:hypothetical protein
MDVLTKAPSTFSQDLLGDWSRNVTVDLRVYDGPPSGSGQIMARCRSEGRGDSRFVDLLMLNGLLFAVGADP